MAFSSPLVVSLTLNQESDIHSAGLTTLAFKADISQQCALIDMFADQQYERWAFSFSTSRRADMQTGATKSCMQIVSTFFFHLVTSPEVSRVEQINLLKPSAAITNTENHTCVIVQSEHRQ